jgi:hypothetical protein
LTGFLRDNVQSQVRAGRDHGAADTMRTRTATNTVLAKTPVLTRRNLCGVVKRGEAASGVPKPLTQNRMVIEACRLPTGNSYVIARKDGNEGARGGDRTVKLRFPLADQVL